MPQLLRNLAGLLSPMMASSGGWHSGARRSATDLMWVTGCPPADMYLTEGEALPRGDFRGASGAQSDPCLPGALPDLAARAIPAVGNCCRVFSSMSVAERGTY